MMVRALLASTNEAVRGRFVVDTGAVVTTVDPSLIDRLGYSERDGEQRTRVRTAIGEEQGYVLRVARFAALGFSIPSFRVHVFDIGFDDIDGLVGLNFLNLFNYEIRPTERHIVIGPAEPDS